MTTNTFLFCAVHSNKLTEPFLGLNTPYFYITM